jgi:hypothetical protein
MVSKAIPAAMAARGLKGVVKTAWWSMDEVGGRVECFLRMMGGSINRLGGGAGAAISDKQCSGASLAESTVRALARGEEMGLSETRYVVAKMLSRSSSWGRSIDDFQSLFSRAMGAVRERPVCERLLGVTGSCSASDSGAAWLAVDLTDAGGEVFAWASGWGDMGSTLIRPCEGHLVAGWVADIAGWALRTLARMRSLGRDGDTAEGPTGADLVD